MITKKRFLAIVMALLLLLLCGCKNSDTSLTPDLSDGSGITGRPAAKTVRVLFSSKDSLDPYSCVTEQNAVLGQLIFEPLVSLTNQYDIEYRLAKSVTVSDKLCSITLRDCIFSDGTDVTAADVVFSFNKAKKSKTRYADSLKYVKSVEAVNTNTVSVTLSRNDPNFANLLTFPIMKSGSDELKDKDNQLLCPIGAGRYVFDNETDVLSLNKNYYGKKSAIKTIQTVDAPDEESVEQAVKAGMVDYYFTDLSNNIIPKMNGIAYDVAQTRMVFIGVNPSNPQLSNSLFRQALSSMLNREAICSGAYFSKAEPAIGPFPSSWEPAVGYMNIQTTAKIETAISNVEFAGFTKKNKEGYFLLKNGNPITFSLLVNSDNESRITVAQQIVKDAKSIGIKIKINAVTQKQYYSLLKSKHYDLFLGEIRIEENMDLGGLVSLNSASKLLNNDNDKNSSDDKKTSSKTSSSEKNEVLTSDNQGESSQTTSLAPGEITLTSTVAYKGYYNGKYSLQDLITAFTAELPVIPICFRNGLVIYSDRFGNGITPTRSDLFHGIQLLK